MATELLQISSVINQSLQPKAGDVDDCWAVATMAVVHAVAPWVRIPSVTKFRAAAGNPDDPGPDGGSISQIAKAVNTLWPKLGAIDIVSKGRLSWKEFRAKVKDGHPAVLFCVSRNLPLYLQYGFLGLHAVSVAWDGEDLRLANPLAPAQSRWQVITELALERAAKSWPGTGIYAVLMPTVEDAFKTHPLYPADCL